MVYLRRRQWHPTPVLLPGKSHGRRSLEGCSPWGHWGSDMTERLHFHFSLSCIGEGNGNLLQCSCLENPRDGAPWWASVYGVAQSQTRLKWLSSCSIVASKINMNKRNLNKIIPEFCKVEFWNLCDSRGKIFGPNKYKKLWYRYDRTYIYLYYFKCTEH